MKSQSFVSKSLDGLQDEWDHDKGIDQKDLGAEIVRTDSLFSKYWKFLIVERMVLKRMEADFKKLKLKKFTFFMDGPTKSTEALGWKWPAKGKLTIKAEAERYVDCEEDIIEAALLIGLQHSKVDFLEGIKENIQFRNNAIKTILEWQKYISGTK